MYDGQVGAQRGYAALLGDVIGSRRATSRNALQSVLRRTFDMLNSEEALQQLQITIGDEFQAVYRTAQEAFDMSLRLRLAFAPDVDARFGIGWGSIPTFDPDTQPYGQDGPAWWAARDALEQIASERGARAPRGLRTVFRLAADQHATAHATGGATDVMLPHMDRYLDEPMSLNIDVEAAVNAYLLCRDELVGQFGTRDRQILAGLLDGRSQAEMAAEHSVSASAVSQRVSRKGMRAVTRAAALFGGRS